MSVLKLRFSKKHMYCKISQLFLGVYYLGDVEQYIYIHTHIYVCV